MVRGSLRRSFSVFLAVPGGSLTIRTEPQFLGITSGWAVVRNSCWKSQLPGRVNLCRSLRPAEAGFTGGSHRAVRQADQKISCPVIKAGDRYGPMGMMLLVAGSNKRILVAALMFFALLLILLTPDACLSSERLDPSAFPVPTAP